MNHCVRHFFGAGAFNAAAAAAILSAGREFLQRKDRFTLVLSGGSTPRPVYEAMTGAGHALDWSRTHIFFGDERCVPPEHEWSNYGMARQALIDNVPIPPENVHRIQGELGPEEAARAYEQELRDFFGSNMVPFFDMVLLGMGPDGHTASLFPGHPATREISHWTAPVTSPPMDPRVARVTLTLPVLNAASRVLFLLGSKGKEKVLEQALSPLPPPNLPVSMVSPTCGLPTWFVLHPKPEMNNEIH